MAPCRHLRLIPQLAGIACFLGFLYLVFGDVALKGPDKLPPKGRFSQRELASNRQRTSTTERSIAQALHAALPPRLHPPAVEYSWPVRQSNNREMLGTTCFDTPGFECSYMPGPVNPQCCCFDMALLDKKNIHVAWSYSQWQQYASDQNISVGSCEACIHHSS
jgi:hypothetical protein